LSQLGFQRGATFPVYRELTEKLDVFALLELIFTVEITAYSASYPQFPCLAEQGI
jgi:hypothetical protein